MIDFCLKIFDKLTSKQTTSDVVEAVEYVTRTVSSSLNTKIIMVEGLRLAYVSPHWLNQAIEGCKAIELLGDVVDNGPFTISLGGSSKNTATIMVNSSEQLIQVALDQLFDYTQRSEAVSVLSLQDVTDPSEFNDAAHEALAYLQATARRPGDVASMRVIIPLHVYSKWVNADHWARMLANQTPPPAYHFGRLECPIPNIELYVSNRAKRITAFCGDQNIANISITPVQLTRRGVKVMCRTDVTAARLIAWENTPWQ